MKKEENIIRIFFTADIHNSELVFRKILSIPSLYNPDVIIISGDLTGKAIVPIIKKEDGSYICTFQGEKHVMKNEKEVKEFETKLLNKGIYPYICSKEEVVELQNDQAKLDALFKKLTVERIEYWVRELEEKVPENVMVLMMPGNDDIWEIDEIISSSKRVINPLKKVVNMEYGYQIISLDYVNPTPWNTPREADENEIMKMLEKYLEKIENTGKVICNFHCPPYNTNIDLAPKLDKKLRPVYKFGELELQHVGSKSIRKFMEKYSPLLGLHGHIHEAEGYDKVGRTLVINPGSQYSAGMLKGIIVDLDRNGIVRWFKIGS
jgi:Icc-related predicted phosphoesterase